MTMINGNKLLVYIDFPKVHDVKYALHHDPQFYTCLYYLQRPNFVLG